MKKTILFHLFLTLSLAACSDATDSKTSLEETPIPTKLIFAAPKIKNLTPEMKKAYKDWVVLLNTSAETQNCQTLSTIPVQKTKPFLPGESVLMTSRTATSGFYCPLQAASLLTFKASVISNDRTRQLLKLRNDVKMTSEVKIVDALLRNKNQLSHSKTIYSATGLSAVKSALITHNHSVFSYQISLVKSSGEIMTMTSTGETSEYQGLIEVQISGVLKTNDEEIQITSFIKNGVQQTLLNGHLIEAKDKLPQFPLPQVELPALELINI